MEVIFEEDKHPVCAVAHPHIDNRLAIGFIDGNIGIYDVDMNKNLLTVLGGKRLKQAVRRLIFSQDGAFLYSAGENRSLCVYDLLNMKRIRCITESHGEKPSALSYLPSTSTKGQQVATGCENGEIKTWDLRSQNPLISTYNEQTEEINGFGIYKNTLLAAGADCILGAYDLRKRKLQVKSEVMHNELLCVEVGPKYTYVGSGDGYLEIFKNGEYGNILDRVACLKGKGVDCLKILQNNIVVTASCEEDQLRLFNVQPYQKLNMVGEHADGIGDLEISANKKWICSVGFWKSTIKFWDVENVLHKMLAIRDTALSGKKEWIKRTRRSSSFFDELCEECDDGRMDMDDGSDQEPSDLNELVDEGESIGSSDDDSTLLRKRRKVLVKSKYTRSGKRFKEHSDGVGGDDEMLNGSEDDGQEGDDGDGDDHDKDDSDDVDDGEEEDEDDDDDDVEDKA